MSIRPEPSVVGAVVGQRRRRRRLRAGHRQRLQIRKREQHRVLVALTGQVLDAAAVVTGHRRRRRHRRHRLKASATRSPSSARSPSRTDRRPKTGAAAAGAAKTSASPPPSPNSGRFAPERRRPPLRRCRTVGRLRAAPSDVNTSPMLTEPLSAGARSANSGTADSFSQSAKPSFQMYVSPRISPRSTRARTSASEIGPTCSPSTTMCQPPPSAAARRRGRFFLGLAAAHHDDVAALLAADLEDLAPNLVVGNRVFGPARITNDLHQRLDSEIAPGRRRERTAAGRNGQPIILRWLRRASVAAQISPEFRSLSCVSRFASEMRRHAGQTVSVGGEGIARQDGLGAARPPRRRPDRPPDQLPHPRDEPRRRLASPRAACPTTRRPASRRDPRRSARPRRGRRCRAASRPRSAPPRR